MTTAAAERGSCQPRFATTAAGFLLVAAVSLMPRAADAQDIICFSCAKSSPTVPADQRACLTDRKQAADWMARTPFLKEVKKNVDLFVAGSERNIDPRFFYNDANNKDLGNHYRDAVQGRVRSVVQGELDRIATDYFTKWQPACEACVRFQSWWQLFEIARQQREDLSQRTEPDGPKTQEPHVLYAWQVKRGLLGGYSRDERTKVDIRTLRQEQVEFQGARESVYEGVQKLVDQYNILAKLRSTVDRQPQDDGTEPAAGGPSPAACEANMLPKDSSVAYSTKQCTVDLYEQLMDKLAGRLVDSLQYAASQKPAKPTFTMKQLLLSSRDAKGNRLYDTACPDEAFPGNYKLRDFER